MTGDVDVQRPQIRYVCLRCHVTQQDIKAGMVIVSPKGRAHYGGEYGDTDCGIHATGDGWWWPL